MSTCDNCRSNFNAADQGIITTSRGRVLSSICGGCCDGARKVKIVLSRREVGGFVYDQFAAIEMMKAAG